jgi:hypothetical protein
MKKTPKASYLNRTDRPIIVDERQIELSLERRGFVAQRQTYNKVKLLNGLVKLANYLAQDQGEGTGTMPFLVVHDSQRLRSIFCVLLPSCGSWECDGCISKRNTCLKKVVNKLENSVSLKLRRKVSIKEIAFMVDSEMQFGEELNTMIVEFKRLLIEIGG